MWMAIHDASSVNDCLLRIEPEKLSYFLLSVD